MDAVAAVGDARHLALVAALGAQAIVISVRILVTTNDLKLFSDVVEAIKTRMVMRIRQ